MVVTKVFTDALGQAPPEEVGLLSVMLGIGSRVVVGNAIAQRRKSRKVSNFILLACRFCFGSLSAASNQFSYVFHALVGPMI